MESETVANLNQLSTPAPEEIELEVLTALSRISAETRMRKLFGTVKSPGVFIGEKALQKQGAQFCIGEQLIQEAGVLGKGKGARPGFIITDKGLKYIEQSKERDTSRKWKAIDQQVNSLVEEHNDTFQMNFIDKTTKIEELKARFQADLKKLMVEQSNRFERLIQQVRNTMLSDFKEQAHNSVQQLLEVQAQEIDRLIQDLQKTKHQLLAEKQ